ncbi:heme-binding domain-containing protein [Flagellimonas baculiformis]|uniref:heme-binding domain-containing protein n=1 Tax=Flagellimonas baculiformis TaxID=3067310 RepID=UPI00296F6DD1|nr:heme-binding domain-containing protein [Muricauda sp. D6]
MKIVKKIALVLLVVLVGMQFYRPEKNQVEGDYVVAFEAETQPSAEVKEILRSACYDCHSDHTEYPWYNNVAPISYWLADHIKEGKEHLNFSDWENYTAKKKDHKLEEVVEEVKKGSMPLKEYTWTHGDARLTQEQIIALVTWADGARAKY